MATYDISSWTDLDEIRNKLGNNNTFRLVSSLTPQDSDYAGIGDDWDPIGTTSQPFDGTFTTLNQQNITSGNINKEHAIEGLTVQSSNSATNVGLFGVLSGSASIDRLILRDVDISNGSSNGSVGAVAGDVTASNQNTIKNVFVDGDVLTEDATTPAGMVLGTFANGTLENCGANGRVAANVSSDMDISGLVTVPTYSSTGPSDTELLNCYSIVEMDLSNATDNTNCAALVVANDEYFIDKSYAAATAVERSSGSHDVSGISIENGLSGDNIRIEDAFWDSSRIPSQIGEDGANGLETQKIIGDSLAILFETDLDTITIKDAFDSTETSYAVVPLYEDSGSTKTFRYHQLDSRGIYDDTQTKINDWLDLQNISSFEARSYVLNGNLSSGVNGYTDVVTNHSGGAIVERLIGSFDGDGNSISDISFNDSNTSFYLFGIVDGGVVTNLNVNYGTVVCDRGGSVFNSTENATITNISVDASIDGSDVSALTYFCGAGTVVNDCSIEGSIDGSTASGVVHTIYVRDSGLGGDITIDNCDVEVDIVSSNAGSEIVHTIDRFPQVS